MASCKHVGRIGSWFVRHLEFKQVQTWVVNFWKRRQAFCSRRPRLSDHNQDRINFHGWSLMHLSTSFQDGASPSGYSSVGDRRSTDLSLVFLIKVTPKLFKTPRSSFLSTGGRQIFRLRSRSWRKNIPNLSTT